MGQTRLKAASGGGGGSTPGTGAGKKAANGPSNAEEIEKLAAAGAKGNETSTPVLSQVEQALGGAADVTVHANPDAATAIGAEAYTQGGDIVVSENPSLHTMAHEYAHAAMQQAGKAPSGVGTPGDSYEQHADRVADAVVAGNDSEAQALLHEQTGGQSSGQAQAVQSVQLEALPKKEVTATAMARLGAATSAINHTKSVLSLGAGNQYDALEATNFNSYFRLAAMRDDDCWEIDPSVLGLASRYPDALIAAKADLARGGNCGEHAMIAFDWLRMNRSGDTVNRCDKTGLDHAFVIIGDIPNTTDNDLVVCDPWPTAPTACLWEDHFAFTSDRSKLNTRNSVTGDDADVKAAIAKGLKLTDKGEEMIKYAFDDERTKEELEKGTDSSDGKHPWIWRHADAARRKYDYHGPAEEEPAQEDEAPSNEEPVSEGYASFLSWLRSVLGV